VADIPVLTQTWDNAAVTTLAKRAPSLAKQTLDRHPFLNEITVNPITSGMGLRIEVGLEIGRNTSAAYLTSPDARMELVDQNVATMAVYRPSLLACPVKFNRVEKVMNSGKEQFVKLMTLKSNQALRTMKEIVAVNLWGTGANLKTIGMGAYVPQDPTTGIVGGINSATNKYWQSQQQNIGSFAANGHLGSSADLLFNLWLRCTDGDEEPAISIWEQAPYEKYHRSLGGLVRYIQQNAPGKILGDGVGYPRTNLMYQGKPAILDKKADANAVAFLHKGDFSWYVAPGMNFEPTDMITLPTNPLVTFVVLILFHQLVCSRRLVNGRAWNILA
jgi:hypothetical protein